MNSLVCVDANLIIPTLVPHPLSDQAEQILRRCQRERMALTVNSRPK